MPDRRDRETTPEEYLAERSDAFEKLAREEDDDAALNERHAAVARANAAAYRRQAERYRATAACVTALKQTAAQMAEADDGGMPAAAPDSLPPLPETQH